MEVLHLPLERFCCGWGAGHCGHILLACLAAGGGVEAVLNLGCPSGLDMRMTRQCTIVWPLAWFGQYYYSQCLADCYPTFYLYYFFILIFIWSMELMVQEVVLLMGCFRQTVDLLVWTQNSSTILQWIHRIITAVGSSEEDWEPTGFLYIICT